MILYLHGFRSAPASHKASRLRQFMEERGLGSQFWCEQLPVSAFGSMTIIEERIARCDTPPTLIGSSLGGYYATWLAEKYDLKAVLVNPSVLSYVSLEPYLGEQTNMYNGESFVLTPAHLDEFRAIEVKRISRPERYWLMVETGDEVLDYRHAVEKYAGARQTVLEGGDHSFTRWDDYLEQIIEFAGIRS